MKKILLGLLLPLLLFVGPVHAQPSPGPLLVGEEDASPDDVPVYKLKFSNGSVTNNNDGTASISSGGGSGAPTDADYLTVTANGSLSAEVVIGKVDDTVIVANGTTWEAKAVADCQDSGGNHLNYAAASNAFSCGTSSSTTASGWTDGGTNVYTSTTTDLVGIGTTTPATTLEIVKQSTSAPLMISSSATGAGDFLFISSGGSVGIGTTKPNPSAGLVIMNGNVGIGTWSPFASTSNTLTVNGGISYTGTMIMGNIVGGAAGSLATGALALNATTSTVAGTSNNANANTLVTGGAGTGSFATIRSTSGVGSGTDSVRITGGNAGATELIRFTGSGNIGIGTTSPSTTLELVKQSTNDPLMISSTATGDGDYFIVKSGGNVGIGTVNPLNTLQVKGTFQIDNTGNAGGSVQAAANQACNTTCVSACMLGLDQGTLGAVLPSLVGCADASADQCFCMGPN